MALKKGLNLLTQIGHLWLKKNITRALVISIILIIVQTTVTSLFFSQLPPKVPLYYSQPWGENQLADSTYLFILPISSLIILIVNSILAALFVDEKSFYSYCLVWVSATYSFFCLINLTKIIQIVL